MADQRLDKTQGQAPNWVGSWVQTDRAGHEAFARLVIKKPRAAALMHTLIANMADHNAVVISQKALAKMLDCHVNTVIKAIRDLQNDAWIEVRQIGGSGSVNAYVVNDRIAWHGKRENIRYSSFSAQVVLSSAEQPDEAELDQPQTLRQFPRVQRGEKQLPSGPGEPPPSEPALPGMDRDLPSLKERDEEARPIGDLLPRFHES